ncbi:hypothetical protein HOLDEFILI_03140 [Holdemania filiformis DSM 12042]|uniref:Uncharacterized protein n=1 Tax=Holdemania filiformis DSM 12042 TaxID=545696 RepID=B9YBD3_9FIRM|nr:hypothetical protein HOLDEFILI_03140 [Holdemania filiformis DSM 12042]
MKECFFLFHRATPKVLLKPFFVVRTEKAKVVRSGGEKNDKQKIFQH